MGRLTTHVLDTAGGRPAEGVVVTVTRLDHPDGPIVVSTAVTNQDGRTAAPLLEGSALVAGRYEIAFAVGGYFAGRPGQDALADPPFIDEVPVRIGLADADGRYHVPLLVSPWSYATYRGS